MCLIVWFWFLEIGQKSVFFEPFNTLASSSAELIILELRTIVIVMMWFGHALIMNIGIEKHTISVLELNQSNQQQHSYYYLIMCWVFNFFLFYFRHFILFFQIKIWPSGLRRQTSSISFNGHSGGSHPWEYTKATKFHS